ncbi:inositol phospholipid synthesis and fat-storage-inducing TM-domain-containing protein [Geopyxis carbonaria]|nr:inositol phospholipid synthesis and fat-storage-inducing TM-domain-containing protein [Geopyxis carbonaria]
METSDNEKQTRNGSTTNNGSTKERRSVDIPELASKRHIPEDTSRSLLSSLPTAEDILLAGIYPITLVFASLYYNFSQDASASSSYFSQKGNLFNVYFVKGAWGWTSVAFLVHIYTLRFSSKSKALMRWALATVWWMAVTQWFFGAPLMDRTFTWTGGKCDTLNTSEAMDMSPTKYVFTSAACKVVGGKWAGGHDLSGHVFILTHASLFLWSEVMPTLVADGLAGLRKNSIPVMMILGLWWWMLLMTGIYFHTWVEKLTGWMVAMIQWTLLYAFALRSSPDVRAVLGVPGV